VSPRGRTLQRAFGRQAFGEDPEGYDRARPGYPDWVWETLRARCGLGAGATVLEIGAGTGTATRRLLAAGAHVVALEPDPRLAEFLVRKSGSPALDVRVQPFEALDAPAESFDLILAATSFHWLDEPKALRRIAPLLRRGGWLALLWNVFGDDSRADPFHDATQALLADGPRSPGEGGKERGSVALAVGDRMSAFGRAGAFQDTGYEARGWELVLDPDEVVALYSTFSEMAARPPDERRAKLAELRRIAADAFAGKVTRNMTTILYTARRRNPGPAM
jgi:SAM-dependent methyltransferase